jgi:hypothetical protein
VAGGILKGFGIPLIVLGIVLLVAGIAAAATGYVQYQENERRGLFNRDPGEQEQALMVGGGIGFASGLVLLIVGLVLNAAGNGRRHRELLLAATGRAPAAAPPAATPAPPAPPAPAPTPAKSKAGLVVAVVSVAVLLLAVLLLIGMGDGDLTVGTIGASGSEAFAPIDANGTVRQAFSLPVAGSATTDTGDSQREFAAPFQAQTLHLDLTWDRADAGADTLRIIVEVPSGTSDWAEVGRAEGASGVTLDLPLDGAAHLRYHVFPAGDAVVAEQPFHVHVAFA